MRRPLPALALVVLTAAIAALVTVLLVSGDDVRQVARAPAAATTPAPAATTQPEPGDDTTPTLTQTAPATSSQPAGRALFARTCGGCHTLAAAGTPGGQGPDLDAVAPDEATVADVIANGREGMPPGLLTGNDAQLVAAYVASVAGR